jgi:hypothetical protein
LSNGGQGNVTFVAVWSSEQTVTASSKHFSQRGHSRITAKNKRDAKKRQSGETGISGGRGGIIGHAGCTVYQFNGFLISQKARYGGLFGRSGLLVY